MKITKNRQGDFKQTGQALVEVVFAIAVLVPALLLLADLYLVIVGSRANEDVCRNAARAAAAVPPANAGAMVDSVLDFSNSQSRGAMISSFKLAAPISVAIDKTEKLDSSTEVEHPTPVRGNVTVSTEVEVKSLILQVLSGNKPLRFTCRQTCPLSYVGAVALTEQEQQVD